MIRTFRYTLLLLWAGLALPGITQAQNTPQSAFNVSNNTGVYRFSRKQCVTYALEHANSMKNALQDMVDAKYFTVENRAIGLPQLRGSFQVQDFPVIPQTAIPANIFNPSEPPEKLQLIALQTRSNAVGAIEASQLLFDGRYIIALRATRLYRDLYTKLAKRTEIETVNLVSKAYYNVLVNEHRLELFQTNRDRLTKILNDTKAQKDNGFAQQIDVDRLQVSLNNLETEYENTKRLVDLSRNLLKFQMGMPQEAVLELTDKVDSADALLGEADLAKQLDYDNRIEVSVSKTQIGLNRMDMLRYQAGYLPTLNAEARYSVAAFRNTLGGLGNRTDVASVWPNGFSWSIRLDLPIFDGFLKHAQVQRAKVRIQKSENDLENLKQNLGLQHANARTNLTNALKQLEIQKRNQDLAGDVYRVAQARYKEGLGTNIELVEAEASYKTSQNNYVNALLDAYVARVDLKTALGTLTTEE
jgi:outer membrane protein TolC